MFDLFAGDEFDQPDLDDLARRWRDHGLHLMARGGASPALTYTSGQQAGDPDAPSFELLRLANLGRLLLQGSARCPGQDLATLRQNARWSDLAFIDPLKGRRP